MMTKSWASTPNVSFAQPNVGAPTIRAIQAVVLELAWPREAKSWCRATGAAHLEGPERLTSLSVKSSRSGFFIGRPNDFIANRFHVCSWRHIGPLGGSQHRLIRGLLMKSFGGWIQLKFERKAQIAHA
jgi:hypothetical protein